MPSNSKEFSPLKICVLTASDTRTQNNDTSGDALASGIETGGHTLYERKRVPDDIHQIRAIVCTWIADPQAQVILITGGTGFTGRDSTPEAITPILEKEIVGFGELFRQVSYNEIGTSTIQSRAFAGLVNRTLIFCMPGSTGACRTAWNKIIRSQLDSTTEPCNFYGQVKN